MSNQLPRTVVLELPPCSKTRAGLENSIVLWQAQLAAEWVKPIGARQREIVSKLLLRLEAARTLLRCGKCDVFRASSARNVPPRIVTNVVTYLRVLMRKFQVRAAVLA